jgi:hypothetical protein
VAIAFSQFTERYDSRFPVGLAPKLAPRVEEMADFWCRQFFERPLWQGLVSTLDALEAALTHWLAES